MKMSTELVSSKPVSLSRAAKILNRFAFVENGSTGAVPMYLQRTAEAFNHLLQFHSKHKMTELENYPDLKRVEKLQKESAPNNNDNEESTKPQDSIEPRLEEGKKYPKKSQGSDRISNEERDEKLTKTRKSGEIDDGNEFDLELRGDKKKKKKNKKRRTEAPSVDRDGL